MMKPVRLVTLLGLASGLSVVWAPAAAPAATHTVNPGESIQAAVDAAAPGDTVKVMPGDYTETRGIGRGGVRITKPLKLIAKSKPSKGVKVRILPGAGADRTASSSSRRTRVIRTSTASRSRASPSQGFPNNGIWLRHVNNFKIEGNESIDNLENGIWPTLSANGLVKKNVSYGSRGQRAVGRGVRERPGHQERAPQQPDGPRDHGLQEHQDQEERRPRQHRRHRPLPSRRRRRCRRSAGTTATGRSSSNHVHDNNEPNTAPPGSMSAELPPGGGILVLGVDRVTVDEQPDREQRLLRRRRDRLLPRGGRYGFRLRDQSAGRRVGAGRQPGHRQHAGGNGMQSPPGPSARRSRRTSLAPLRRDEQLLQRQHAAPPSMPFPAPDEC